MAISFDQALFFSSITLVQTAALMNPVKQNTRMGVCSNFVNSVKTKSEILSNSIIGCSVSFTSKCMQLNLSSKCSNLPGEKYMMVLIPRSCN